MWDKAREPQPSSQLRLATSPAIWESITSLIKYLTGGKSSDGVTITDRKCIWEEGSSKIQGEAARVGEKKGHHRNISFWAQLSRELSACSLPAAFKGQCSVLVKIKDIDERRIKCHTCWKCQQPRSASRTQVSPTWYDQRTANVMMSLGHRRASVAVVLCFPTPAISFKHPSSPQLSFPVLLGLN